MIRFIARKPLTLSDASSGRALSDPDLLSVLADKLRRSPSAELEDAFSQVMHDLRIAGTWKRTNRGRLPLAQRMVCKYVRPMAGGRVTVLDLGASDGTTTLDLLQALQRKFFKTLSLTLADVSLWLFRYRRGPLVEYRSSAGEAIMARVGPFGLRLARDRRGADTGDRLAALYLSCEALRHSMHADGRISLIHPLVEAEQQINAIELDCLIYEASLTDRFSALRASNVLNLGYFDAAQLKAALSNIHAYLHDEGFFIASRNHDVPTAEVENGTVWCKQPDRFLAIEDFGGGSEIRQIVDEWRAGGA